MFSCVDMQVVNRRLRQWTGQGITANSVVCDFEMSIIIAVETEIPTAAVCACYFHFTQSLWRKIQQVGLASVYNEQHSVRRLLRKIMAIAFLPIAVIRNNLRLLSAGREWRRAARRFPGMARFLAYFERICMNDLGHFPPRLWNVYHRSVNTRTNNFMEGIKSECFSNCVMLCTFT